MSGATEEAQAGWNHSFYRDQNGRLHILHPRTHNYCTNWITFYK